MNSDEVEKVAAEVTKEWIEQSRGKHSPITVGTEDDDSQWPSAGSPCTSAEPEENLSEETAAYWPLGSATPVKESGLRHLHFVAAKSVGTSLVFGFTLDQDPDARQYVLLFDFANVLMDEMRAITNAVFVTVLRLVGSLGCSRTHQRVFSLSATTTLVLPETWADG